jgi:Ni,Fe-hydrogenase maturation factor
MVKRNGFTWSDYLLESAEILGEDILGVDVAAVVDAAAAVQEAGEVLVTTRKLSSPSRSKATKRSVHPNQFGR